MPKTDYPKNPWGEKKQDDLPVVERVEKEYNSKSTERTLRSLLDAHLQYTGRISGKLYNWNKSGDTVSILEEDLSDLLSKRTGGGCCGNYTDGQIFEIVE